MKRKRVPSSHALVTRTYDPVEWETAQIRRAKECMSSSSDSVVMGGAYALALMVLDQASPDYALLDEAIGVLERFADAPLEDDPELSHMDAQKLRAVMLLHKVAPLLPMRQQQNSVLDRLRASILELN